ncbi:MAG: hypothetical protein AAGB51_10300 [Planctomycetota bacterium]
MIRGTPELWRAVRDDPELCALAAAPEAKTASGVGRLRKRWDAELVGVALAMARGAEKIDRKWVGESLCADPEGAEMASTARASRHKADRFVTTGAFVIDLCCGIGADARALAERAPTVAVDHDPVRAWLTAENSGAEPRCVDAASVNTEGALIHVDPSRRVDARRLWRYEDLRPGPSVFEPLCETALGAALKLGPGVDPNSVPSGELEFISEAERVSGRVSSRRLTQAVLWVGALCGSCTRRATLLLPGETVTLTGDPAPDPLPGSGSRLYTIDPAVERADLVAKLAGDVGLGVLHARVGMLVGDPGGPADTSPWLTSFDLIDRFPWSERASAERLRSLSAGVVEVKPRGVRLDTDRLQARFRGDGDEALTLFVLRFGDRIEGFICRRVGSPGPI